MKKKILAAFVIVAMMVAILPTTTYASGIAVNVNGQPVVFGDQAPVIVDGRTLVPVRGVFEVLGFDIVWNDDTRQATLSNANYTVVLTIDSATFTVNGVPHTLEVPAQIIGGSTMLPLSALLGSIGYDFAWSEETQQIAVTSSIPQVAITPLPAPQAVPQPTQLPASQVAPQPPSGEIPDYITIAGMEISTSATHFSFFRPEHAVDLSMDDIVSLRYLTNLTVLSLWQSEISDLTPFAELTNLTSLSLLGSQITDLTPLAGLTNLTTLGLGGDGIGGNQISDLTPLAGLTNLTELRLDMNQISDLTPLAGLTNHFTGWTGLNLVGNPITDWSPVDHIDDVRGRPVDWVRQ